MITVGGGVGRGDDGGYVGGGTAGGTEPGRGAMCSRVAGGEGGDMSTHTDSPDRHHPPVRDVVLGIACVAVLGGLLLAFALAVDAAVEILGALAVVG